jgi:hypothetical protein
MSPDFKKNKTLPHGPCRFAGEGLKQPGSYEARPFVRRCFSSPGERLRLNACGPSPSCISLARSIRRILSSPSKGVLFAGGAKTLIKDGEDRVVVLALLQTEACPDVATTIDQKMEMGVAFLGEVHHADPVTEYFAEDDPTVAQRLVFIGK